MGWSVAPSARAQPHRPPRRVVRRMSATTRDTGAPVLGGTLFWGIIGGGEGAGRGATLGGVVGAITGGVCQSERYNRAYDE